LQLHRQVVRSEPLMSGAPRRLAHRRRRVTDSVLGDLVPGDLAPGHPVIGGPVSAVRPSKRLLTKRTGPFLLTS